MFYFGKWNNFATSCWKEIPFNLYFIFIYQYIFIFIYCFKLLMIRHFYKISIVVPLQEIIQQIIYYCVIFAQNYDQQDAFLQIIKIQFYTFFCFRRYLVCGFEMILLFYIFYNYNNCFEQAYNINIMVRFKNRYIVAQLPKQATFQTIKIFNDNTYINSAQQKALISHIKNQVEEFHGQLLLAKISFSLQIKYMSHGYTVIRVPRDHCSELVAALFTSNQLRVKWVSGTIRKVHKWLFRQLRLKLGRQLEQGQAQKILNIDYS